ncbi:VOC family protein [Aeromicrobium sp.]|uniref:VOC family protein n=1 Tax=Aeromicrobium sp. TaxID=1871063 RepID=UPI003D6AF5E8
MSDAPQLRLHHLALTVADLDASIQWYGAVFDVHPVLDVPHQGRRRRPHPHRCEPVADVRPAPPRRQRG